ncbi:hypothetical protein OH76DRAFT_1003601 [Lentinus brumalis]|uniref:Uncharacterized protein n=1 Tax=Lentinus brumalis TaxID=2498619 RepID=A0A371CYH7_9APHY|nr:hypothetical protein OH76DRAFT_1003601 [Polyporus brumalis]
MMMLRKFEYAGQRAQVLAHHLFITVLVKPLIYAATALLCARTSTLRDGRTRPTYHPSYALCSLRFVAGASRAARKTLYPPGMPLFLHITGVFRLMSAKTTPGTGVAVTPLPAFLSKSAACRITTFQPSCLLDTPPCSS